MAGRGVNRLRVPGRWPIPPAVVGGAQVRASLQRLSRNDDRIALRVAGGFGDAAGIYGQAAGLVLGRRMAVPVPVACPFPDISDHVEQAKSVRRVVAYRGRTDITVRT